MDKIEFKKGEIVVLYSGTVNQSYVTYINNFMYKGEKWYNIQLQNGGYMETKFISKKP